MQVIDTPSALRKYIPSEIRGLLSDGQLLLDQADALGSGVSDYSYLVFPFSKAYEGFLKKLFLDLGLIRESEYYSDDIRIGRILNPGYIHEHASVYKVLRVHERGGEEFSRRLWTVWKVGRNAVFHYFPHNFRRLSFEEAQNIIKDIVSVMEIAVEKCISL